MHFTRARVSGWIFSRVFGAGESARVQTTGRIQMRWGFPTCKPPRRFSFAHNPRSTFRPLCAVMEEAVCEKSLSVHRTSARRASFPREPSESSGSHSRLGRDRECYVAIGSFSCAAIIATLVFEARNHSLMSCPRKSCSLEDSIAFHLLQVLRFSRDAAEKESYWADRRCFL